LIKLGSFEFSRPPDIFRSHKGLFFVAGSLPDPIEAKRLREVLESSRILDFQYEAIQTRILVGDTKISLDVIWGQRYELLLHTYNPLELTRRKISTGEVENIGEKMLSPRFKVAVEGTNWRESLPKRETLDYEVKLRIRLSKNAESFKIQFKDQYPVEKARHDFSKWTTSPDLSVEILLGYLQQGDLLSVSKGKATQISHGIVKSGNWVKIQGNGKLHERPQQSVYLIKEGVNIIAGRLERTVHGNLLAHIKTFLLPDLKPKDSIDVCSKNLGIHKVKTAEVETVTHIYDLNGALTQFTFVL